jgi:hypothetical protein
MTYTHHFSDEPEERRDITVRELAEEQLKDIESNGPDCDASWNAGYGQRCRARPDSG